MRPGFTLVEMALVLAILALTAHLAVRELSTARNARLSSAADAQLETLRDCVYSRSAKAGPAGFLADMGRLPRLAVEETRGLGGAAVTNATLAELWAMPTNALPYAVREAVGGNLCAGVPAAPGVYVPTGWRGPYLRLKFGQSRLFDPWGNPMEREDSAGLARLGVSNSFVVAAAHFGPCGQPSGERRISLVPDGGAASRLVVTSQTDGTVAWYGPASGLVTGAVAAVTAAAPAVFEGLSPGMRVVVHSGGMRLVEVRPGDNLIVLEDD